MGYGVLCLATKSRLTPCDPMDCSLPDSSVHGILQARILEWVVMPSSRGSNPGLLNCKWILYCLSHQGKPKHSGLDSLSLLQGIVPTQELNQVLLPCKQSLYQLSCQESPVLVAQSCPTLCDPMDCSPPGSSIHGILQTRILEWVAIPFSRESS